MVGFSYVLVYGAMGISEMFDEPMFDLSGCISHVLCFTSMLVACDLDIPLRLFYSYSVQFLVVDVWGVWFL